MYTVWTIEFDLKGETSRGGSTSKRRKPPLSALKILIKGGNPPKRRKPSGGFPPWQTQWSIRYHWWAQVNEKNWKRHFFLLPWFEIPQQKEYQRHLCCYEIDVESSLIYLLKWWNDILLLWRHKIDEWVMCVYDIFVALVIKLWVLRAAHWTEKWKFCIKI